MPRAARFYNLDTLSIFFNNGTLMISLDPCLDTLMTVLDLCLDNVKSIIPNILTRRPLAISLVKLLWRSSMLQRTLLKRLRTFKTACVTGSVKLSTAKEAPLYPK